MASGEVGKLQIRRPVLPGRLPLRIQVLTVVLTAGYFFSALGYAATHVLPTLYWDGWGFAEVLLKAQGADHPVEWLRALHWKHNEHRPGVAKIVILADWYLRPGTGVWINLGLMAAAGVFVVFLALRDKLLALPMLSLCLTVAGLFLAPVHIENTAWFTQTPFPLMLLFSFGLIWVVVTAATDWEAVVLASILAVLCVYTMAAGLLAPVAAASTVLLFRADWRRAVLMIIPFAIAMGIYLTSIGDTARAAAVGLNFGNIPFVLAFLGSFFQAAGLLAAQVVGAIVAVTSLCFIVVASHQCWIKGHKLDTRSAAVLGAIGLILAIALTTGLSRGSAGPPSYALVSRYAVVSLTGILLILLLAIRWRYNSLPTCIAGTLAIVALAAISLVPHPWSTAVYRQQQQLTDFADIARAGIYDAEAYRWAYPSAPALRTTVASMRQSGLGMFDARATPNRPPTTAIQHLVPERLPACPGLPVSVSQLGAQVRRVSGHFVWGQSFRPAWIVGVTPDGQVVGWTRPRPSLLTHKRDEFYLTMREPVEPATVIGLSRDGGVACRVIQQRSAVLFRLSRPEALANATPVQGEPSLDGFAAVPITRPPLRLMAGVSHVYSSGIGGGQGIGRFRLTLQFVPEGRRLAIPVAVGEDYRGLALRVKDSNGLVVAEVVPSFREHHVWYVLDLPASVLKPGYEIVVNDEGRDWGQWLAIGHPLWLPEIDDTGLL